ncbi:MAG: hypothetical protein HY378_00230 [Candidatus Brennerbacteria bacterium]|nr:hypothetical protein [Candidatus Brennerbacteria bacterium]
MLNKGFLLSVGLLSGTIIGAGIFSLPYLASRVGLATGFFYLIFFTLVYVAVHAMYGKILEAEKGEHQFFYLARKYFSGSLARLASFIVLAELIFVMLVYLVLAPTFARLLFGSDGLIYVILFWLFGSIFIFAGLKVLEFADFAGVASILAIVLVIVLAGEGGLETPVLQPLDLKLFFLPFGPLLFSLAGRPAMHKVIEVYRAAKARGTPFSLVRVAFWGTFLPSAVYLLFVFGVLRLNPAVSPEALDSLVSLPSYLVTLLGFLGLITLWTSYFMIGVNVKDILRLDLKKSSWFSAAAVLFSPLVLYSIGFKEFLPVITFTGSIFLALEGVFVIAMWRRAFPAHRLRWVSWPLYAVFLVALLYALYSFVL